MNTENVSCSAGASEWELPEGYQFVDENGNVINATKIVLEKKKPKYPQTYEECCEMLNALEFTSFAYRADSYNDLDKHYSSVLTKLRKLLICRDAYWKIAGEEMGLGKPWMPDLEDGELYFMYYSPCGNIILKDHVTLGIHCNVILAFPTEEMRDAFYENFKELIKSVKELL